MWKDRLSTIIKHWKILKEAHSNLLLGDENSGEKKKKGTNSVPESLLKKNCQQQQKTWDACLIYKMTIRRSFKCVQNVLRILHRLWENKSVFIKATQTLSSVFTLVFKGLGCRLFTCLLDVSYSICFPTFTNQQRFWGFPDCPVPPHTFVTGCARLPHTALP